MPSSGSVQISAPLQVVHTDDGYKLDRGAGAFGAGYRSIREALAACLDHLRGALKAPVCHDPDTHQPNGVWRWIDATAAEPAPARDGSQVTDGAIRVMCARLNASPDPIQLDGGTLPGRSPSPVHGSLQDSGQPARGWGHLGVPWVDATGRTHLALYAEVFPDVNRAMDSGELRSGSIGFEQSLENPDDAVLVQHALTNRPAVYGLVPNAAMRTADDLGPPRRFGRGPLTELNMPDDKKKKTPSTPSPITAAVRAAVAKMTVAQRDALMGKLRGMKTSKRATIQDVTPLLIEMLGNIDPAVAGTMLVQLVATEMGEPEDEAGAVDGAVSAASQTTDVMGDTPDSGVSDPGTNLDLDQVVAGASKVPAGANTDMQSLGGIQDPGSQFNDATGSPEKGALKPVANVAALKEQPAPVAAKRAVAGLEGPALEAWAADALATIQALMGQPAAAPGDALAWLKTNQDKLAGAMAASAAAAGGGGAVNGQDPVTDPAMTRAQRAEVLGLEATITTERTARAEAEDRAKAAEDKLDRMQLAEALAARFRAAKITLSDEHRAELVGLMAGRPNAEREALLKVALRSAPPAGTAPAGEKPRDAVTRSGETIPVADMDQGQIFARELDAVRKETPKAPEHEIQAKAYERTKAALRAQRAGAPS